MKDQIAYSTLHIKAIDEEKRQIVGIASTPMPDRADDIVEPDGAEYTLPIPFLMQHDHNQPVGHVTAAKVNSKKQIEVTIDMVRIEEPGILKDRLDEAWQLIKYKLVRGLSIGFRSVENEPIKNSWGIRFLKWDWFELSAVTVPANMEATIQTIKSIHKNRAASGSKVRKAVSTVVKSVGDSTKQKPKTPKLIEELNMATIAEQIASTKASREAKQKRMHEIMEKAGDEGLTLDAAQQEEFDTLVADVEDLTKHLSRLDVMEKANIASAKPVENTPSNNPRGAVPAQAKNTEKLEPGIEFARFAMCKLASKGNPSMAVELAKTHYGHNERVVKALESQARGVDFGAMMKATVEAGTTLDATWAAPLVDYQNFAGDFVEYLRNRTIIGQFGRNGVPALNNIPFNVRIAGQTSGGSAGWVGEGAPKPLTAFDFNAVELRWAKVAAIAVLTNELIRFSNPQAERLVRDALAGAVIERIDIDFVDPAKAAVTNVSPASITNGITGIASSGNTADDIRADVQALWAPFIAARNAPRNAVYIMDSTTALALSLLQNPLGQAEYPGLTLNGGTFMGVPVIVSDYLPSDSAGGIVILANASDIWLADDNQVTIDASQEASLQMLDNPTNNSATGTATSMVSMFQTNSTAFRAERFINWQRRRTSAVAYLTGVQWGQ